MNSALEWDLRGLTKQYPAVVANDDVSLQIRSGEIHGLLGENGCGKSTLIGLLSGVIQPTSGTIMRNGERVVFRSPQDARAAGIATVFQEFSLVPYLTVAENLFLGQPLPTNAIGLLDRGALRRNARAALAAIGLERRISVDEKIVSLSVAEQQLVEIAKAVSLGGTTLILDEPTAALGATEIDTLHQLLRRLKKDGRSILYVSHRLDEVVEIVDRATILKDGKVVSTAEETPISVTEIVTRMIGANPSEFFHHESHASDEIVLRVDNLRAPGVHSASFDLRRGEVLGIAGLMGSGRTEILKALFGVEPILGGRVELFGTGYRPSGPAEAIRRKVGFVPENRKTDGLFFNLRAPPNATIAALDKVSRAGGFVSRTIELSAFDRLRDMFKFPAQAHNMSPRGLSGGNQQKLVLARWLFAQSQIILLDEPTQGVDVGAKSSIYDLVRSSTADGRSVILVSSDNEELLALSDRIAIVREGVTVEILEATVLNEHKLTEQITGARHPRAAPPPEKAQ
ncbi:MAG: sugar ABC transporter ATP-binding protein [Alphaproteobacteria bacterium]|nr:sugar ABC transporter ATP-binding protein [Alphaproteobacteria bacterium]